MTNPGMEWFEAREKVRAIVTDYHDKTGCRGTLRGIMCRCDNEVMKMMVFRELTDKWLS